jgi:hypothetical protein
MRTNGAEMQTTVAKDGETGRKPGLHWRQRKKLVARRKALEEEAAARKPALIDDCVQRLGGRDCVTALQMQDVERYVDLELIAGETREACRLGKARIEDVARIEIATDKARRRLNLPAPGRAAAPTGLHDIVRRHAADRVDMEGSD